MFGGDSRNEFRAKLNGKKSAMGYLVFEDGGLSFHEDFSFSSPVSFTISRDEINSINFVDSSTDNFQPSFWRVFFLRLLAFARPKNWSKKSCQIEIETVSGEFMFFEIENLTANEVRVRINQTVSRYF